MAESLMKGHTWADAQKLVRGKPRFEYPIYVEVKADEIRCQVKFNKAAATVQYLSYDGKPLYNMESFTDQLVWYFTHHLWQELDIGILVNNNFNDSYRWTRSSSGHPPEKKDKKTGKVAPALDPSMVQLILFDLPEDISEFRTRIGRIDKAAEVLCGYKLPFIRPARAIAQNHAEVMQWYEHFRSLKHEGAMGKTFDHVYERRRTYGWLKIKPKETLDGVITGINQAHTSVVSYDAQGNEIPKGSPLPRAGSVSVRFEDGSTADCGGLEHAFAALMWQSPADYIGQWAECERMEEDRQGGSRHPIFKRLRESK